MHECLARLNHYTFSLLKFCTFMCLYNCIHSANPLKLYSHSVAERISIDSQSEGEEASMSHHSSSSGDGSNMESQEDETLSPPLPHPSPVTDSLTSHAETLAPQSPGLKKLKQKGTFNSVTTDVTIVVSYL